MKSTILAMDQRAIAERESLQVRFDTFYEKECVSLFQSPHNYSSSFTALAKRMNISFDKKVRKPFQPLENFATPKTTAKKSSVATTTIELSEEIENNPKQSILRPTTNSSILLDSNESSEILLDFSSEDSQQTKERTLSFIPLSQDESTVSKALEKSDSTLVEGESEGSTNAISLLEASQVQPEDDSNTESDSSMEEQISKDDGSSYSATTNSIHTGSSFVERKTSAQASLSPLPLQNIQSSFSPPRSTTNSSSFSAFSPDLSSASSIHPMVIESSSESEECEDVHSFSALPDTAGGPHSRFSSIHEDTALMLSIDTTNVSNLNEPAVLSVSPVMNRANTEIISSKPIVDIHSNVPKKRSLSKMNPAYQLKDRLPPLASPKVFVPQFSPSMYAAPKFKSPFSPLPKRLLEDKGIQSYALTPPKQAMEKVDDDSTDDEDDPKDIPLWAQKPYLAAQVRKQHEKNPDPTLIFPIPYTCNLEQMFAKMGTPLPTNQNRKRKKRPKNFLKQRGSSGNWTDDRVTEEEKDNYRKKMKYK